MRNTARTVSPNQKLPVSRRLFVNIRFQEPRQPVEVAVGLDVANFGDERFGIDEFVEGNEVELELADDRDHHAIETILNESAVGTDAQLAAEHHVERLRPGAA